jgi:mannose-6-phosphate isomerase-like protein (cupin superfamily)
MQAVATKTRAEQVTMLERNAREGDMPPLLRRSEDETYRVIEGEVVFFVGSDMVWAGPGDEVVAPAHAPRTFRVASARARWLVLTTVSSRELFHDFARAISAAHPAPASGWPSADERDAVAAMGAVNGIELLGPPGALPS